MPALNFLFLDNFPKEQPEEKCLLFFLFISMKYNNTEGINSSNSSRFLCAIMLIIFCSLLKEENGQFFLKEIYFIHMTVSFGWEVGIDLLPHEILGSICMHAVECKNTINSLPVLTLLS